MHGVFHRFWLPNNTGQFDAKLRLQSVLTQISSSRTVAHGVLDKFSLFKKCRPTHRALCPQVSRLMPLTACQSPCGEVRRLQDPTVSRSVSDCACTSVLASLLISTTGFICASVMPGVLAFASATWCVDKRLALHTVQGDEKCLSSCRCFRVCNDV